MAIDKCRECGKEASSEAKTCPHCGVPRPVKKTSILAWCVAGVFVIIAFKVLTGNTNQSAPPAVRTLTTTTTTASAPAKVVSPPPVPLSTEERKTLISEATKGMTLNRDKMEKISFYTPKSRKVLEDRIYAYISIPDSSGAYLRVVPMYYGSDWVFFEEIKVLADDVVVYEKQFTHYEITRDNNSGDVWEYIDYLAAPGDVAALRKIATASNATIRFAGREHRRDFDLSKRELDNIKKSLEAYDALEKLRG